MTFIYETVHYPSTPNAATRPEHLQLIGKVFGMRPRPVAESRILEIGCGVGGNLLPLAERFPNATFLGIDLAVSQIAAGQKVIDAVGLTNIELRAYDLTRIDASFGEFDYIIAHGVYSWVPEAVRARLIGVIKERLAPQGIGLVSHNVKPGWHVKAMTREMMLYHTRDISDATLKVNRGREFLEMLKRVARPPDKVYHAILVDQTQKLRTVPDQATFHDDFSDDCAASYFHEFAAELGENGLQYLGDSHMWLMWPLGLGPEAGPFLAAVPKSIVEREQYLDFMNDRNFRYTLMCHADLPIAHGLSSPQLTELWLTAGVTPEDPDLDPHDAVEAVFKSDIATARANEPLTKAALLTLGERWPQPMPFGELCLRAYHRVGGPYEPRWIAALIAGEMLMCFVNRVVDLSVDEPGFVVEPGERPRTTKLIRWQAQTGVGIVALVHKTAEMDSDHRRLLGLLDGTRDRPTLAAESKRSVDEIDKMLKTLAKLAVIVE